MVPILGEGGDLLIGEAVELVGDHFERLIAQPEGTEVAVFDQLGDALTRGRCVTGLNKFLDMVI